MAFRLPQFSSQILQQRLLQEHVSWFLRTKPEAKSPSLTYDDGLATRQNVRGLPLTVLA
jgi:hypothetical protein